LILQHVVSIAQTCLIAPRKSNKRDSDGKAEVAPEQAEGKFTLSEKKFMLRDMMCSGKKRRGEIGSG